MKNLSHTNYSLLDKPEACRFIFHPRREVSVFDESIKSLEHRIPVEKDVFIGGRFYLEKTAGPNILFFHGNGEIVADYHELGVLYNRMGINFLAADYRGYGRSSGEPTVSAMMTDCHAILQYVQKVLSEKGFSGPLVLMGRSLGSASAIELASGYPDQIKGLIVESGFAFTGPLLSLLGVNLEKLGFEEKKGFGNLDKIKTYKGPTLIIHAVKDQVIPFNDGKALFEASPSEHKVLLKIPEAGHNDIFIHGFQEYLTEVKKLVDSLV